MSGARAARRAAAVRSGACWSRREEASDEPGKREEGARAGRGKQPGARSFVCSVARALRGCSRAGRLQQVGSVASTPRRRRWPGSSSGAPCGGGSLGGTFRSGLGSALDLCGCVCVGGGTDPWEPACCFGCHSWALRLLLFAWENFGR